MSDQPVETLKVVIDATSEPLQKEAKKAKQATRDMADSVNNDTKKIKNPLQSIMSRDKTMIAIRNMQQKIKQSIAAAVPKDLTGGMKERMKNFQLNAGFKVHTEEFKQVESDIQRAEKALDKLYSKRDKMEALGVKEESMQWKSLAYDIRDAEAAVDRYNKRKANMQKNGTDVERPYSLPMQLGKGAKSLALKGFGGMGKVFGGMKSVFTGITTAIKKTSGAFGALIQKFKTGIPWLNKAKGSFGSLGGSGHKLGGILQTLAMTARFMFASFLLRGALDGAKAGMQNLAQYSGQVNSSISMLMSSLTQLKNSLATAFAPILNVVAPALNVLIQKISQAVSAIGMLFAALTGQSTFTKATSVQQDYASSLNSNANSANKANEANKKLQRTLLGFDQINKLDDDSDSDSNTGGGGAGGLSPADMFEEVPINSKIKEFADKLKKAWKNADFTEIGQIVGNKLNEALSNIPWSTIQSTLNKIAKSIATFLNGFIETVDWGLVGNTLAQGINTVFMAANTFAQNFHWDSLGIALGNGINGAMDGLDWNLIQETIHNVVSGLVSTLNSFIATANWNLVGKTIAEYFNSKLEVLYTAVTEFDWNKFGKAIADSVNGAVKNFDWAKAGTTLSEGIKGILDSLVTAIENIDWKQLGEKIKEFLINVDWSGIVKRIFELLGAALGGLAAFIGGLFGNAFTSAKDFFGNEIEQMGGDVFLGICTGIAKAVTGIDQWIKENIFEPFINGFKEAFGIHSPAKNMEPMGKNILLGVKEGFLGAVSSFVDAVGDFWNNSVKPLFTKKKWKENIGEVKEALSEKWDSAKTWWSGTAVSEWWNSSVKPKFTKDYWKNNLGSTREAFTEKWSDVKTWWKGTAVSQWWENVKSNFTSDKWKSKLGSAKAAFSNKWSDVKTWWNGAKTQWWENVKASFSVEKWKSKIGSIKSAMVAKWNEFKNWWSSLKVEFPKIKLPHFSLTGSFSLSPPSVPTVSVQYYASGGFPDTGQLFVANEAGPELVGKMGHRNVVANNLQIVSGIKQAVSEAMMDVIMAMKGNEGKDGAPVIEFVFKVDSETFYKVVKKGEEKYNRRYHVVTEL